MKRVLVQFLLVLLNISQVVAASSLGTDTLVFNNWGGSVADFKFDKVLNSIQLNGNQANKEASVFCANALNSGKWSFRCKMEFNPSSQNYGEVFLVSNDTIASELSGYSVVIGKNSDRIELVKHVMGTSTTIIKSIDNFLNISLVDVFIVVERSDSGLWSLHVNMGNGLIDIGTFEDKTLLESQFFMVRCQYTSTRSTKFWFSEMSVVGKTIEPIVLIDRTIEKHDILISELMIDPSPLVNLPEVEYLELYNRTSNTLFLGKMKLQLNGNEYSLPMDSIYAHEFLALTSSAGVSEFQSKGRILGMTSFPSLSNSGFTLFLTNDVGCVIDGFCYNPKSYEGFKTEGGWALERQNGNNIAFSPSNWGFSMDLDGGTPGVQNSVWSCSASVEPSELFNISYLSDSTFQLNFTKEMSSSVENIQLVASPTVKIKSVSFSDSLYLSMGVNLKSPIDTNVVYSLDSIKGFLDADGLLADLKAPLNFGKPVMPTRGNLWINEVLFDASSDGGEFIEFYNSSPRLMETNYLRLKYNTGNLLKLSDFNLSILPNSYVLLINKNHSPKNSIESNKLSVLVSMEDFPQLANEEGSITLLLSDETLIDSMHYASSMHHPSIINKEDVSLERSFYDGNDNLNCWNSASSSANYSTPGMPNSNKPTDYISNSTDYFVFPTDYFSPNNDGTLDRFHMVRGEGCKDGVITVKVFDERGVLRASITENAIVLPNEELYWDGSNGDREMCEPGIYVILITGYNSRGETFTFKKIAVLAPK